MVEEIEHRGGGDRIVGADDGARQRVIGKMASDDILHVGEALARRGDHGEPRATAIGGKAFPEARQTLLDRRPVLRGHDREEILDAAGQQMVADQPSAAAIILPDGAEIRAFERDRLLEHDDRLVEIDQALDRRPALLAAAGDHGAEAADLEIAGDHRGLELVAAHALHRQRVVGAVEHIGEAGHDLAGEEIGEEGRRLVDDHHADRALLGDAQVAGIGLPAIAEPLDLALDALLRRRAHILQPPVQDVGDGHRRNVRRLGDILDRRPPPPRCFVRHACLPVRNDATAIYIVT